MPIVYPYKFSDWYGYDKDCTPVGPAFYMTNTSVTGSTAAYACNYIFPFGYASIYYHDGTGATPVVGDVVYTDAAGNNEYNPSSDRWVGNATGHTTGGTGLYRFDSGGGQVEQLYTCSLSSFSSSVNNNPSSVCSATMNQTYYHNGPATIPIAGNTTYSSNSGTYPYLSSGNYKVSSTQYITVGSNGLVSSLNTCSSLTSFYVTTSTSKFADDVCDVAATVNLWHDGSNTLPANGDTVYQTSAGTSTASWVGYKGFYPTYNGNSISASRVFSGVLNSATLCP